MTFFNIASMIIACKIIPILIINQTVHILHFIGHPIKIDPIIEDYHKGFKSTDKHPAKNWGDVTTLGDLDPEVIFHQQI